MTATICESKHLAADIPVPPPKAAAVMVPLTSVHLLTGWGDDTRRICWAQRAPTPGQWECHRRSPLSSIVRNSIAEAVDQLRSWGAKSVRYMAEGAIGEKRHGD